MAPGLPLAALAIRDSVVHRVECLLPGLSQRAALCRASSAPLSKLEAVLLLQRQEPLTAQGKCSRPGCRNEGTG